MDKYVVFDEPLKFYDFILDDIQNAKKEILIEVYKFNADSIGRRFRNALIEKAKQGIKVKVLADSFGSTSTKGFFEQLIAAGGEVRFFKKIKLFIDSFTKNHRRNHRKIITIDRKILYTGSANITSHCLDWRELMLRAEDPIVLDYVHIFNTDYESYDKYSYKNPKYVKSLYRGSFMIARDNPSPRKQRIMNQYMSMIRNAKESIIIETPYFLPSSSLRKTIVNAAKKGVKVKIVMPLHSDVTMADMLRNSYFGKLYESGVELLFYTNGNLHAKLVMIDGKLFSLGSPNIDYRSFRYQHEIVLIGINQDISQQLKKHIQQTLLHCKKFDFEEWKKRSGLQKLFELIFKPLRYYM